MARTIFETAKAKDVGPVILELARSEQTYTFQRVFEYAPNCLAGAIAAGWVGPVFIQGDHYQFNAKKYAADPEAMTEEIRKACRDAVAAGYLNIDIDSSTLVDLSKPTVDEQQRVNYTRAAEITALIRDLEPAGVTISVGGEIGEVGKQNSNEEELRAYLDGFRRELDARGPGRARRQQGQRPDRHEPRRRAAAGRRRGRGEARLRGPAGPRRGRPDRTAPPARSSTARAPCPTACSTRSRRSRRPRSTWRPASRTPSTSTRPSRPSSTREIEAWCFANAADERKDGMTDSQFVYTTRKKAIGPFKRRLWSLPTKDEILASQAAKLAFLFDQLRVTGTADLLARYVPERPGVAPPGPRGPDGRAVAAS